MNEPKRKAATYEDVLRAPDTMVAEVVEGDLYLTPRPSKPHTLSASRLGGELSGPFGRGNSAMDEAIVRAAREAISPDSLLMVDAGASDAFWPQDPGMERAVAGAS